VACSHACVCFGLDKHQNCCLSCRAFAVVLLAPTAWLLSSSCNSLQRGLCSARSRIHSLIVTHTCEFNGPLTGTTRVSRYQKGKTNLDFTEARDREWQWHQLGHTQVCTSLRTDNHASTPPVSFLQTGCPSCHPTNSVKALKAKSTKVL